MVDGGRELVGGRSRTDLQIKPCQDETPGVAAHILTRIEAAAPHGVWFCNDFLDLGGHYAIEKALQRLVKHGHIRRPLRGLYDCPTKDPATGRWQIPSVLSFVDAIARRDRLKVLIDGMTAAHALGLTRSRPFSTIVYANTRPRMVRIDASIGRKGGTGPQLYRLTFKRFSMRTPFFWAGHPAMLLIQAFHWMHEQGRDLNATVEELVHILKTAADRHSVASDLRLNVAKLEAWTRPFMQQIADALHPPQG